MGFRGEIAPAHEPHPPDPIVAHPTNASLFSALDLPTAPPPESTPITRRTLFKKALLAGAAWAGQNIDQAERVYARLRLVAYLATDPALKNLAYPPSIEKILFAQHPTTYGEAALQKTHIITFGDSIARGEVDGDDDRAPAGFIVGKMNRFLATDSWKWQNEAWNGATTKNVITQIENLKVKNPDVSTDVLLSVGGNDTLAFIKTPETIERIDQLIKDPSDPELLRLFAQSIQRFLTTFRNDLTDVVNSMRTISAQRIAMQRLYIHGVPDMGNAKNIVLPTGKKFLLEGDIRTIASHVSKLLNYTILTAIADTDTDFDVIFIDNSPLQREHFSDMHPNRKGYELMADHQMRQGVVQLYQREPVSLYTLTQTI